VLPAKRRARIIELLRVEGAASLRDMSETLGISLSTIRRDVEHLCESGHMTRTRGGAVMEAEMLKSFEPAREIASALASAEKRAIGERAAALIQPNQTVIFDSGTTTGAAALSARDRNIPFTVVTNDLHIGTVLSANSAINITVTGGHVRPSSPTLIGAAAALMLGRLRADIAFIGTHAVVGELLWDTSTELAEVKRTILKSADFVVLLADSSKFLCSAFCAFGRLTDVDLVITDDGLKSDWRDRIRDLGIPLELAAAQCSD